MEAADRDALADDIAQQAAALCDGVEAAAPDEGLALARFGRAATVSMWDAMVRVDVNALDRIIDIGFYVMIAAGRNPARLFPPAPDLLETLTFMAWCHLERFAYRLAVFDLEEAQRYAEDALTLGGAAIAGPAMIRAESVIAGVALRRYELVGDPAQLDDAIARLGPAVELVADANAIATLASCLRRRAATVDDEAALRHLQDAGGLLAGLVDPVSGPPPLPALPLLRARWLAELAQVHAAASKRWASAADLRRARELVRDALQSWPRCAEARLADATIEGSIEAYGRVVELAKRPSDTSVVLPAAETLAALAAASGRVDGYATRVAEFAWKMLQQAIDNQVEASQKTLWLPRLSRITAVLVPARAAGGDLAGAVDCAESIRTRILQESFPDENNELFELAAAGHRDLSASIRHALGLMRDRDSTALSRARARDLLWNQSEQVRRLPGFSSFRTNPKAREIAQALDGPVVYLVPGEPAGVALVIHPGDGMVVAVPLPLCTRTPPPAVERFRTAAFGEYMPAGARRTAVGIVSAWAWDAIHAPLAPVLAGQARVHLIGLSYLGLIPIHAARQPMPTGDRHAIAEIEYRYAPSARALIAATKRQVPQIEPRFMVVPQPVGAGADLEGARDEAAAVAVRFDGPVVLPQEAVTSQGLREAIGGVGWLHVACHGIADAKNPLDSGLVLRDAERFRLSDLFGATQRHLLLTVLSACQTNVPDVRLPDESTSLAAGLFIGGCRAVIASAWQVPDAATSALMRRFYDLWRRDGHAVPDALRRAQVSFAQGGEGLEGWRAEWSEPYFWAGFSYLGP